MDAVATIKAAPLADCVTIDKASEATGLTEAAIRRKIHEGVWVEGRQYHRAPDRRIYINLPGVIRWVTQGA